VAVSSADGLAQEEEGKKARARAGSRGDGSRPTGPIGPEGGREKKNEFSFSNLIFQIHFPKFLKLF
jgi:hypothetical protein